RMGHSKICQDDTTYFNTANGRCGPCPRPPSGREINPNCGYDDYGGRHEVKFVECRGNKFNDGTHYKCQPCSLCALGFTVVQPWMVPLTFIICCATIALSCWFIYRKRGAHYFVLLEIHVRCVLDDLDVLDELIMLLDPETKSIKNTKHLASLCSFSSNWVTYTYSLKETKSPLRALLEGVNCRHPDWTVEHLALLLQQIDRVDAVVALRNLSAGKLQTFEV
uniref:IGF-like family receptor 1 n=1 Tax=Periophthalmus magnuspinnatus TaxID=409849 RepID=A0A3B3ZL84_9GOBI